jgi:hypothetical protein
VGIVYCPTHLHRSMTGHEVPHCHTTDLLPTMIEDLLPAMGCGTCHGALVSLLYYRHWAEVQKEPAGEPASAVLAGSVLRRSSGRPEVRRMWILRSLRSCVPDLK